MMTDATLIEDTPPTLLESILSLLEQHTPGIEQPARERAASAFIRSLGWMEANPHAWEIKHVKPLTYINELDKPQKLVVRGRVVDVYKAITVSPSEAF